MVVVAAAHAVATVCAAGAHHTVAVATARADHAGAIAGAAGAGHAGAAVGQAAHGGSAVGVGLDAGAVANGMENQHSIARAGVVEDRVLALVVGLAEDQGAAVCGLGRGGPGEGLGGEHRRQRPSPAGEQLRARPRGCRARC